MLRVHGPWKEEKILLLNSCLPRVYEHCHKLTTDHESDGSDSVDHDSDGSNFNISHHKCI